MLRTLTVEQHHKCLFSFHNLKVCSRSFSPVHTAKGLKKKLALLVAELSTMVNNFNVFPHSPPLLVSSKHFTDIHLKTTKMVAFDDAPYIQ